MLFPPRRRTWIVEQHAQIVMDAAVEADPQMEDEINGVEWMLIRNPGRGVQVGPDVYLDVNHPVNAQASLITTMYTFNEDEVNVLRIWIR